MTDAARDAPRDADRPVSVLDRGLSVLRFMITVRDASINEIADATGLSRSTAYRLVDRLACWNFVESSVSTGRWHLGPAAAQMGMAAVQQINITHVAPELLRLLVQQTRETVGLAVPSGYEMVFISRERSPQSVAVAADLGSRRPLHCTSVGKAYLAALSADELASVSRKLSLVPHTPSTITSRQQLTAELERVRQRGWAEDHGEFDEASTCCAAPVFDHTARPIAALSVAGPTARTATAMGRLGPIVASTAEAISYKMGYSPRTPK